MKTYNEMVAYKIATLVWHLVKNNKVRRWCVRMVVACIEKDVKACKEV